jgi:hypothetical protein
MEYKWFKWKPKSKEILDLHKFQHFKNFSELQKFYLPSYAHQGEEKESKK